MADIFRWDWHGGCFGVLIMTVAHMSRSLSRQEARPLLVPVIVGINILVFLLWHAFSVDEPEFMMRNFLVSWSALEEGRLWTLLSSVFSHVDFWHIFINMYVLSSFGGFLEIVLGKAAFLKFYCLAGIVSSLSHCLVSAWVLNEPTLPALGASGAISGLVLLFALLFPRQRLYLFGIVPMPALWGALAFVGLDVWGLVAQARGGGLPIGHGAHLGGALFGAIYYFVFLRPRLKRHEDDEDVFTEL